MGNFRNAFPLEADSASKKPKAAQLNRPKQKASSSADAQAEAQSPQPECPSSGGGGRIYLPHFGMAPYVRHIARLTGIDVDEL